ncbi:MAG: Nramp family divalent metal transporter [Gammaproteobacteria bacterium]
MAKRKRKSFGIIKGLKRLGPGLITGASDDDPSGIATYSQTGAKYGFQLLWLAVLTLPLMIIVQEMCARLGLVTGKGLAANVRQHHPKFIIVVGVLLFATNTFNIAADLSAMGAVVQLVIPPLNQFITICSIVIISSLLQIFIMYQNYARYLKYLTLALLTYPLTVFFVPIDFKAVLVALIHPTITVSKEQIWMLCAVLGTTISPYLFFWQTSQEVEEKKSKKRGHNHTHHSATPNSIWWMRFDTIIGMCATNLIMFFIILVCGATLFKQGVTNIQDAAQAASALKPIAGSFAEYLFALGIFGTGLLAVPVLAGSSAYGLAEAFLWKEGLNKKFKQAYGFYIIILAAMVIALLLNLVKLDPIKTLIFAAVVNGMMAPLMLFFVIRLTSNTKVMGDKANTVWKRILGWITLGVLAISALAVVFYSVFS